jgi:hypothetical protein
MQKNITFFESGLQLTDGVGDLKTALAELVQLAAEAAKSSSASFYVLDAREGVLKPLITYGLPPAYVEACGNVESAISVAEGQSRTTSHGSSPTCRMTLFSLLPKLLRLCLRSAQHSPFPSSLKMATA